MSRQVSDDVLSLRLRLGHVEQDDDGVDDSNCSDQEHVVEEDWLRDVIPRDEASRICSELVVEEEEKWSEKSKGCSITERDVDGVTAGNDAKSEGPECSVGLADNPCAGRNVEVDHDEADGKVDVRAVPDAANIREDVRNEGEDPGQRRVHPQVVEHVVNLKRQNFAQLIMWITHTLTLFVKPRAVLNLAERNIFLDI